MSIFQTLTRISSGLILIQESIDCLFNSKKHLERIKNIHLLKKHINTDEKEKILTIVIKISGIVTLLSSFYLLLNKNLRLNAIFLSVISFINIVLKNPFWIEKTNELKLQTLTNLIKDSTLFTSTLLLTTHGIPNRKWRNYYSKKAKNIIK